MADHLVFTPTLYPPIGHTTTCEVHDGMVDFVCLMEISYPSTSTSETSANGASFDPTLLLPDQHFSVILWWSIDGKGAWQPSSFTRILDTETKIVDHYQEQAAAQRFETFGLQLPYTGTKPLQFCLKYRFGDGPWLWSGSRIGGVDGRMVFVLPLSSDSRFDTILEPPPEETTEDLLILASLGSHLTWVENAVLTPKAKVLARYLLKAPLDRVFAASADDTGNGVTPNRVKDIPLGKPLLLERWMALVKIANPWMGPIHSQTAAAGGGGGSTFTTNKECLLLLMQRKDGNHVAVLPLSGLPSSEGTATASSYITSSSYSDVGVSPDESLGNLFWRIYDESPKSSVHSGEAFCLVSVGISADAVVKDVMSGAKQFVDRLAKFKIPAFATQSRDPNTLPHEERELQQSLTAALHSGLTYCTWNSLGVGLSGEKILFALKELHEAGIKISNLIIDDNWQTISNNRYASSGTWTAVEANSNFDLVGGLSGLVKIIRDRFPDIQNIGVWHALHGYWDGITPGGPIDKAYQSTDCVWLDNVTQQEKKLRFIGPSEIYRFYDAFYQYLSECGITCVKVDVQCRINELRDGYDRGRLLPAYQRALATNVLKHFRCRAIFCMAHVPSIIHGSLLGNSLIGPLFRTSDDFYPSLPDSHGWHIFANTMNMLLFKHLNIIPDWDMFQTALPQFAAFHAAARCLSGGPVIITDTPGKHDINLILQMVAPTPDGHNITLRPARMAGPSDPYISYTSSKLLRICNSTVVDKFHMENKVRRTLKAFFVGFFNVSAVSIRDLFRLSDLGDLSDSLFYVTRSYRTGYVTPPTSGGDARHLYLTLSLGPSEWDIITAVPVIPVTNLSEETCFFGALGLSTNMTGAAAIVDCSKRITIKSDQVTFEYHLTAIGTLLLYISEAVPLFKIEFCGEALDHKYWRPHPDQPAVVEVFLDLALEESHWLPGDCTQFTVTLSILRFCRKLPKYGWRDNRERWVAVNQYGEIL